MYIIVSINPITYITDIRAISDSYKHAIKRLQKEAENICLSKGCNTISYVSQKSDIKSDGLYIKLSTKYPNRLTIYENRTLINKGYMYNTQTIELIKVAILSVIELSQERIDESCDKKANSIIIQDNTINRYDNRYNNSYDNIPQQTSIQTSTASYIEELQKTLAKRGMIN